MHSIIEPHYLLLRVYIALLFLKGNNIQFHLYQIPLKLNVYIRYVFWAGGLALRNKVMLCYVMLLLKSIKMIRNLNVKVDIFSYFCVFAQTIACEYMLEPPH